MYCQNGNDLGLLGIYYGLMVKGVILFEYKSLFIFHHMQFHFPDVHHLMSILTQVPLYGLDSIEINVNREAAFREFCICPIYDQATENAASP